MKQLFFAFIVIFIFTNQDYAQPSFPEMHGIKIGMSISQVKKQMPFLKISKADKYEIKDAFLYTPDSKQEKRLPKVFKIELLFLRNRLIRFGVGYFGSSREKANNYENFVNLVTKNFNLNENLKTSYRTYEKDEIEYRIGSENRKEFILLDLSAKEILDERVFESYTK